MGTSRVTVATLEGIRAEVITTDRLTTRVLFSGPDDGIPVLFIHGNFSSATWWEESMLALPEKYRAIAPDQRGFGDADPAVKVNAQRGMSDLVEDAIALMDHLGHDKFHLVGNSLGGLVAWWMMAAAAVVSNCGMCPTMNPVCRRWRSGATSLRSGM